MSPENMEIVRRAYDAAARRDTATVRTLYDPEIEWDMRRAALTAAPVGRAFIAEGGGPLDRVLGREHGADDGPLFPPEGLVVPGRLQPQDRLRCPERKRSVGGE